MTIRLTPEPLAADAFAPFGAVIEADHARSYPINQGRTRRYHALAVSDVGADGRSAVSIFRGTPWPQPLRIGMLERHPLGTQAFVPMERQAWLTVVAERPEPDACRAFLCRGDQGVQYGKGVWHHPLVVLAPTQDFLVVDRIGPGDNLDEHWFDSADEVIVEPI